MGKIRTRRSVERFTEAVLEEVRFTPLQLLELKKCHDDPKYFIETYLKLKNSIGPIPFLTRAYQQVQLRAFTQHSTFCLQPRQSGSTSLPLAYQLWEAIFRSNTNHGAAFAKFATAVSGMATIQMWVAELPKWLRPGITYQNQQAIEFDNGSRIVSGMISANFNRGRSWTTLFADCMAFAKDDEQENFWLSGIPSLGSSGRMFITGVPNGLKNTFSQVWHNIMHSRNTIFVPLHIDPLSVYSQLTLDGMRHLIGDRNFRREYNCEFIA